MSGRRCLRETRGGERTDRKLDFLTGRVLAHQPIVVPIFRAGPGMVQPFLDTFPDVSVGYIGLESILSGLGDFGDRLHGTWGACYVRRLPTIPLSAVVDGNGKHRRTTVAARLAPSRLRVLLSRLRRTVER